MGTCLSPASSAAESNLRLFLHLNVIALLLVVVVMPSSSSQQVPSAPSRTWPGCQLQQPHRQRHWQTHTSRECQLISHCSKRHVRITGEQVDAKGTEHEPAAALLLVATTDGQLRLTRQYSDSFVCFNRSGHLVVKDSSYLVSNWTNYCSFHECLSDNQFTELRSVANYDWMVGFNKLGDPLRSKRPAKLARCYQLQKRHCPSRAPRAASRAASAATTATARLPVGPAESLLQSPASVAPNPPP